MSLKDTAQPCTCTIVSSSFVFWEFDSSICLQNLAMYLQKKIYMHVRNSWYYNLLIINGIINVSYFFILCMCFVMQCWHPRWDALSTEIIFLYVGQSFGEFIFDFTIHVFLIGKLGILIHAMYGRALYVICICLFGRLQHPRPPYQSQFYKCAWDTSFHRIKYIITVTVILYCNYIL